MNIKQLEKINQEIRDIEQRQDLDFADKTHFTEDLLKEYRGDDRVIPFYEFKVGDQKGKIKTGIMGLDNIIGGVGKGDVITITGDTGDGKTTWSRFLTIKFSEIGKKCLWFSYEETNEEFLRGFAGKLPEGYFPMTMNDTSLTWIEARILEGILKYKTEIVFIDNLYFITDYLSPKNLTTEIAITMRRLKTIALKYNITIFLLAHIKKQDSVVIDKNSIRDSKAVADISSLIIAVRRLRQGDQNKKDMEQHGVIWTNDTLFSLIKNRYNGKMESFAMEFDGGIYKEKGLNKVMEEIKIGELF